MIKVENDPGSNTPEELESSEKKITLAMAVNLLRSDSDIRRDKGLFIDNSFIHSLLAPD